MYVCVRTRTHMCGACGSQKRVWVPLELELKVVSSLMSVLRVELQLSARTAIL